MTRPRSLTTTVIGILGELAVTLGVLVALFAVWQLWWTDVAASATHARLAAEFADTAGREPPVPGEPEASVPPEEPALAEAGAGSAPESAEKRDAPPRIEVPEHATVFALLRVPRWGEEYVVPIAEGVSREDVLNRLGIGHYSGTAMPGELGNFAIAGHRQTYGRPFFAVDRLSPGDALVVESESAWYVYRVSETKIVQPSAVEVIASVPGRPGAEATQAVITLTTCHPLYSTRERFIVHGVFDHWVAKADGYPAALAVASARDGG